jgi:hypothetical protein
MHGIGGFLSVPFRVPAAGHGIAVRLSRAAGRSGNVGNLEPGMIAEKTYIHLTDHAGGPEDSNRYLAHGNKYAVKKRFTQAAGRERRFTAKSNKSKKKKKKEEKSVGCAKFPEKNG